MLLGTWPTNGRAEDITSQNVCRYLRHKLLKIINIFEAQKVQVENLIEIT